MRLIDVAFNNLRRRTGRMALVVMGLTLGVATVVALVSMVTTMQTDVSTKLDEYGANILIVPEANDLAVSYGGVTVASAAYDVGTLTESDVALIQTIENARNLSVVAPKLLGVLPVDGTTVLVAGVRFPDELRLKQWWHLTGAEPAGPDDAVVGHRLADVLDLSPGATAHIEGHEFRIVGVLAENGSQDDDILFIDLGRAQQIMDKPGGISLIEVAALCIECPVEDMVEQIAAVLPQARVTALRQAVTLRMETVNQISRFALAVGVIVLLIGGLVVFTTMLGTVTERRQEIGLFRALGFRQRHIVQIILSEAALLGLLGTGAAAILAPRLAGVAALVHWDPALAVGAIGGALLIGLGASLYPAVSAARLDPTVALRSL